MRVIGPSLCEESYSDKFVHLPDTLRGVESGSWEGITAALTRAPHHALPHAN